MGDELDDDYEIDDKERQQLECFAKRMAELSAAAYQVIWQLAAKVGMRPSEHPDWKALGVATCYPF